MDLAESVKEQLRSLSANQRALILASIETQLTHEPFRETRNRKALRPNPLAPWELRVGDLRAFYDLAPDDPNVIRILAVGEKRGSRLFIAGKEVQL
ncbi:MAG: type II toxin-antitoxin system RelE/ParE family toxin [Planctomycetes bacterium]|nr:type II toxin-antitoxin system RelE/ParE family toxin [Planctomycetota bacterium]